MAAVLKLLAVAFAFVSLSAAVVTAETHHVVGGPEFNVTAWLLGRRFTVGDKIRMECSGSDERMVEVRGVEELESCDVSNPIRMYGEGVNHVALEEEGVRYFTSANPDTCRNGLKLPVTVHRHHDFDPDFPSPPYDPDVPSPPYKPDVPSPPHKPDVPSPPHKPDVPSPPHKPDVPSPPHKPDDPYPPSPAAAAAPLNAFCFVMSAALSIYYLA